MSYVNAIYRNGVFEPLDPVSLAENQRVRLHIQPWPPLSMEQWLERVNAHQKAMLDSVGVLPDSTPDIAADRLRGV